MTACLVSKCNQYRNEVYLDRKIVNPIIGFLLKGILQIYT